MMQQLLTALPLARRARIRSWKDVVEILLIAAVLLGLRYFLHRFFPDWSERKVRVISTIVTLALAAFVVFVIF